MSLFNFFKKKVATTSVVTEKLNKKQLGQVVGGTDEGTSSESETEDALKKPALKAVLGRKLAA